VRTIALTAILAAAVSWIGIDSAAPMGMRGASHASRSYGYHGSSSRGASAKSSRYTPSRHGSTESSRGSRKGTPYGTSTASHAPSRPGHWKLPPRYGTQVATRPPPRGGDYPRPRPRPLPPPILSSPVSSGGTVTVNLPPATPAPLRSLPPGPGLNRAPAQSGPPAPQGGGAAGAIAAVNDQRFVPDEILVSFTGGASPAVVANFAQTQRLALLGTPHQLPLINTAIYHFRITDQRTVPAVLAGLQGDARLAAAQPNYLYALRESRLQDAGGPSQQYAASKLHLEQAHALARGNGVLVALIDSAVEATHPELQGTVTLGLDAVKSAWQPHEHGTAMASAIIAHGRLTGVAPAARIVAVRAFDPASTGARSTSVRLLDSLQWATTSGARVVNMSFTGPSDPQLHAMIVAARQKGMVLVAAAGNDGPRAPPDYPAAYPEVIAVTATDADDRSLKVANHGSYVAVAAPGVDIFVASPNGGYDFTTGTSVAAAHVSGLVALLLERNPKLTPDAVQAILIQTAKDLGPKGRDEEFGAGLVDAYEALLTQASEVAQQPSETVALPDR
jgi:hypothetical protein